MVGIGRPNGGDHPPPPPHGVRSTRVAHCVCVFFWATQHQLPPPVSAVGKIYSMILLLPKLLFEPMLCHERRETFDLVRRRTRCMCNTFRCVKTLLAATATATATYDPAVVCHSPLALTVFFYFWKTNVFVCTPRCVTIGPLPNVFGQKWIPARHPQCGNTVVVVPSESQSRCRLTNPLTTHRFPVPFVLTTEVIHESDVNVHSRYDVVAGYRSSSRVGEATRAGDILRASGSDPASERWMNVAVRLCEWGCSAFLLW
jgi:hypothetical protein